MTVWKLKEAGIVTERGAVVTDNGFKTNVDHIYAIGDVVYGNVQLAHVASAQAIHVVEKLMGEHPEMVELFLRVHLLYLKLLKLV